MTGWRFRHGFRLVMFYAHAASGKQRFNGCILMRQLFGLRASKRNDVMKLSLFPLKAFGVVGFARPMSSNSA